MPPFCESLCVVPQCLLVESRIYIKIHRCSPPQPIRCHRIRTWRRWSPLCLRAPLELIAVGKMLLDACSPDAPTQVNPIHRMRQQLDSRPVRQARFVRSDIAVPGSHRASQMLMATLSLAPIASTFLADAESFILQSDTVSLWRRCTPQLMPSASLQGYTHANHPWALQMRHIMAGTCARTMAQALIHPLDTAKTRLQVTEAS